MNSYTFKNITLAMEESFTVEITAERMEQFYLITGDNSPIHRSEEYAKARGYKGRVCYGMLGAAMFSTLAGVYLPGEHCLLHSVESKFAKPR
ncbi:MAG: MaoC/PaaZ C-terminal domain-containing protein [Oscillospiraceae bacterium]